MASHFSIVQGTAGVNLHDQSVGGRRDVPLAKNEWDRLMVAAQNGDGAAYRRLLADLMIWLRRYFRRRLPPNEIEDAVQDTLMALHRNRHTYDPAYPLSAWLSAIARRKWIDQLRAMERRSADELDDTHATVDQEAAFVSGSVLSSLMGELRPAQSRVIRLVKLEGYSVQEASLRTGQSVPAVKVNIHRGLARLRQLVMKNPDVA